MGAAEGQKGPSGCALWEPYCGQLVRPGREMRLGVRGLAGAGLAAAGEAAAAVRTATGAGAAVSGTAALKWSVLLYTITRESAEGGSV